MLIAAIIAALIFGIFMLPIHIIVKKNKVDGFKFQIKLAGFDLIGKKDKKVKDKTPLGKRVKAMLGLEKEGRDKSKGGKIALGDIIRIIGNLLKEVKDTFGHCTVKKLWLTYKCTGEDAAEAAINYGKLCAVVYPFIGLVHSLFKVKMKNERVNLLCDYDGDDDHFWFEIVLSVKVGRLLLVAVKILGKEIAHIFKKQAGEEKL